MRIILRVILPILFFQVCTFSQPTNKPKNIIIFIGDGMGLNYISLSVLNDENNPFSQFKTIGLSIAKSADDLITDSAAGATAIATGYPTNNKFISVDPNNKPLYTIFEHASSLGLSTGIVVTSDVVCATPSPFIAHHINRHDKFILAEQFINSEVDVVIGGGTNYFLPVKKGGLRTDGINLIDKLSLKNFSYIDDVQTLLKTKPNGNFFSLLTNEGLQKASDRNYTLGDLTSVAIKNLSQNPNGFVLLVEGSQIDWAGHDNATDYIINEMKDFCSAIQVSLDFAEKSGNTLMIITADHETGGMAIEDGSYDAKELILDFTTTKHTAGLIPVFAKGPGEESFTGVYNNFMIGRKLFTLLDKNYSFK